jgi:hypothetical protein
MADEGGSIRERVRIKAPGENNREVKDFCGSYLFSPSVAKKTQHMFSEKTQHMFCE